MVGNGSTMRLEQGQRVRNIVTAECGGYRYESTESVSNLLLFRLSSPNIGHFAKLHKGKGGEVRKAESKFEANF